MPRWRKTWHWPHSRARAQSSSCPCPEGQTKADLSVPIAAPGKIKAWKTRRSIKCRKKTHKTEAGAPRTVKRSGRRRGQMTASWTLFFAFASPPASEKQNDLKKHESKQRRGADHKNKVESAIYRYHPTTPCRAPAKSQSGWTRSFQARST